MFSFLSCVAPPKNRKKPAARRQNACRRKRKLNSRSESFLVDAANSEIGRHPTKDLKMPKDFGNFLMKKILDCAYLLGEKVDSTGWKTVATQNFINHKSFLTNFTCYALHRPFRLPFILSASSLLA